VIHNIVNKFNRGELDPRALDREEVEKILNSCSLMDNWMPMRLGPMQVRAGTENLGVLIEETYSIPFLASASDKALIELGIDNASVWIDDEVLTRPASTLIITNESFAANVLGWTDASTGSAVLTWDSSGAASLTGTGSAAAKMWQTLTGTVSDTGITIVVGKYPVVVSIGVTGVDSKEIFTGVLGVGTHQLFVIETVMTAAPTITISNTTAVEALVYEVSIHAAGTVYLPTPDTIELLSSIRYAQSADVVFFATSNTPQFKVERRGQKSWSLVTYRADDGPFGLINNTSTTLAASALSGDITLTASESLFSADSIGQLYKLSSAGQTVTASVTAQNTGTDSIRVTGIDESREFNINITGTYVATVTLQRSADDLNWTDVDSYGNPKAISYDDAFDNSIFYYRLWVKTGAYTSGTVNLELVYTSGSIDGICRITDYTSPTVVSAQTLSSFGSTQATQDWYPGEWGDAVGYPTAVALYEGRLWWAGKTKLWGSVSDNFTSFDSSVEGASAPIRRTVGFGPVDNVSWLAPSSRLLMGIASDEISVRSSSFGEVLTSVNCNLKSGSTAGVAAVEPVKVNDSIFYVGRSGTKIFDSMYTIDNDTHRSRDLMVTHPDVCGDGIKRFVVVREPETRVYILLNSGELRVYLIDGAEDVAAWSRITVDGEITDISTLPGDRDDTIYITVTRDGVTYKEKMFDLRDATTRYLDNATVFTNTSSLTVTGLDRFNGETVGAWGIVTGETVGYDLGGVTISGGQVTMPATYSTLVIGRRYTADYKTGKISGYMQGVLLGTRRRIVGVGLHLMEYLPGALQLGPTFDDLEDMPSFEGVAGKDITGTRVIDTYDELPFEFNGDWEVDPRICIRASRPCTILSLTYDVCQDGESKASKQS
jgi:hypothetical protein